MMVPAAAQVEIATVMPSVIAAVISAVVAMILMVVIVVLVAGVQIEIYRRTQVGTIGIRPRRS